MPSIATITAEYPANMVPYDTKLRCRLPMPTHKLSQTAMPVTSQEHSDATGKSSAQAQLKALYVKAQTS